MKRARLAALVAVSLPVCTFNAYAEDDDDEVPFDVAKVFFQLNDTDGDLGIHAKIDGDPWKRTIITDPHDRTIFVVSTRGKLRRQGMTELSFESAEPTFDELDPAVFFRRFPEGEYEVEGMGLEGEEFESEVILSHVLPAAPGNLLVSGMPAPEDCDEGPLPKVGAANIFISWDAVTESHPELGRSGDIEITRYEVSVEREEPVLTVSADLPPTVTGFSVPDGLLESGDEIKFQILATDAGGNETSAESCFAVE